MNHKMTFSGHESFPCRFLWLKKGYDFIKKEYNFNSNEAPLHLGVGKNMVLAIKYWLDSFDLINENNNNAMAEFIFDDVKGKDPFLEYIGSLWLLHAKLIMAEKASIYSLLFNEFQLTRVEFTKEHLFSFLKAKTIENNQLVADNSLRKDINVMLKLYVKETSVSRNYEDDLMSLFLDLDLITELDNLTKGGEKYYSIEKRDMRPIPKEIFLSVILLNNNYGKTITFNELLNGYNSPGNIFLLTGEGLLEKIRELEREYDFISYTEDAESWEEVAEIATFDFDTVFHIQEEGDKIEAILINLDSSVFKSHKSDLNSEEQIKFAEQKYISTIYFHSLFLYTINKNLRYLFCKDKGEIQEEVDLNEYLTSIFSNKYADFLMNFSVEEIY